MELPPTTRDTAGQGLLRRVLRPPIARRDGPGLPRGSGPRRAASTLWLLGLDGTDAPPVALTPNDDTEQALDKILRGTMRGGAALIGSPRHHLTRQVILTDLCQPNADRAGTLLLALRHPADLPHLAHQRAPPGRQTERLGEAWGQLDGRAHV